MDSKSGNDGDDDSLERISEDEYRLSRLLEERGDVTETIQPGSGNHTRPIITAASDADALASISALAPDHAVREEIGRGGMGTVHRATDAGLHRDIALKALTEQAANLPTAAARFEREARALAQLEHPNIVPIHRLAHDEAGRPFYTMKLVKGQTLRAVLRGIGAGDAKAIAAYPLDRLLNIFRKVCDAIAFAHHKGVIHRDLKPENIMIGEFGEALVMDWGLAKLVHEETEPAPAESIGGIIDLPSGHDPSGTILSLSGSSEALTMDGEVVGTPRYMAPEQARGDTRHMDERTDVYALGGVLYEILALEPAFSGRSTQEVLKRIVAGDFPSPCERLKAGAGKAPHCPAGFVPPALSAVAMRAMAVRPEERYQQAMDLAADIDAWTGGFATSVEDIGFIGQLRLLIARHRAITATITISLVALVWATNWYIQDVRGAEMEARAAERDAKRAHEEAKQAHAETEAAHRETEREFAIAQIALAGVAHRDRDIHRMTRLLESCPPEYRDTDWRYLHNRIDEAVRTIPSQDEIRQLVGRRGKNPGFYGASSKGLFFIHPGRRECRGLDIVPAVARVDPHSLTLSRDGKVGAVALYDERIVLFDPRFKTLLRIVSAPSKGAIVSMELDPDGSHVYVTRRGNAALQKLDTRTGKAAWTVERSFERFRAVHIGRLGSDPQDRYVAVHTMAEDHPILLFDAETGEYSHRVDGQQSFIWRIVFSPDGELVAAGDYFGHAHVWDVNTGKSVVRIHTGNARLMSMEFSNADYLVTLSGEALRRSVSSDDDRRWLDIWAPRTGVLLKQSLGVPRKTRCLAVDPDRNLVLTGGESLKLWSPPFVPEKIVHRHSFSGGGAGFIGNDLLLAPEGRVQNVCFRIKDDQLTPVYPEIRGGTAALFNAARTVMIFGSRFVSLEKGTNLVTRPTFTGRIQPDRAALNVDGSHVLGVVPGNRIRVVNTREGSYRDLRHSFDEKDVAFIAAAFGKGDQVISIRDNSSDQSPTDTVLELWPDGETKPTLARPSNVGQTTIKANADGSLVAVADLAWRVTIFRTDDLSPVVNFRAHDGLIRDLAFHPGRKLLATVSRDMAIKLWDFEVTPPKLVRTVLGPKEEPMNVAFNADGSLLATSGVERAVRIWEVAELLKPGG